MTDPITDADIDRVIAKAGGDVRQIAAAYLRSSRRAKQAEDRLRLMGMVSDLQGLVMGAAMEGMDHGD